MRTLFAVFITALAVACTPPAPTYTPTPESIAAPINQTWNAVIDLLSEENIPAKTLDKSSGYVMAEITGVSHSDEEKYADCGSGLLSALALQGGGEMISRYNILVRGDSSSSNVKVTATFVSGGVEGASSPKKCATKGVFEKEFQSAVKQRAEAAAHAQH